ncbi:GNAT family N-acetyltransferase, partial [Streptomyces nanshensis]|uniref:GNAT family N-acetyltransferase n=1 Tax=Streptomyces nanshensis TaxID=518642 RepID=UPI0009A04892
REAGQDAASGPGRATSLWRMRTTVPDEPGRLAALCGALAREDVDIVSLQTFPLGPAPEPEPDSASAYGSGSRDGGRTDTPVRREQALDEFVLRAPAALEATDLTRTVDGAGGSRTRVERADAHDLEDAPTRALRLAARTARDTAELPLALRQLLGRCTVRSVPPVSPFSGVPSPLDVPPEGSCEETVLRLPDPAGGVIVVERPQLPFTPAEFARAAALVELDRVVGAGVRVPRSADRLTLPDGLPVTVRRADTGDLDAALSMHERCSRTTLDRRYHGPVSEADRYLRHLLSPRFGRTLAAWTASGRLVALGHLLWDGDESEIALLVEDDWQHRGIGGELLRRLVGLAREAGSADVYAVTQASNTAMVAAMRRLGLPLDHQVEDGTLVITARLAGTGETAPTRTDTGTATGTDTARAAGSDAGTEPGGAAERQLSGPRHG